MRDFLYAGDCAEGIVLAAEKYNDQEPLNISRGEGVTIRELAETIHEVSGYDGEIDWATEKIEGAMHKVVSGEKMKRLFGWTPPTSIHDGLQ